MGKIKLSSNKYEDLTFTPSRVGELKLSFGEPNFLLLYDGIVSRVDLNHSVDFDSNSNKILLSMSRSLNVIDTDKTTVDVDTRDFANVLQRSYEDDIELNQVDSFKKLYSDMYQCMAIKLLSNHAIADGIKIPCFGLVKKDNEVIATIDDVVININQQDKDVFTYEMETSKLTSYYSFNSEETYSILLYNDDTCIRFEGASHLKRVTNGLVSKDLFSFQSNVTYTNHTFDSVPKTKDIENNRKEFLSQRIAHLDFSPDTILSTIEDDLFTL